MADFVNQAILQQLHARGSQGPNPQDMAMQQAHLKLQQQQATAAQKQRDMNQGLTALEMDWVPVEDKVRIANNLGKQFGIQGEVTADGIQPYRQLLTDMQKDMTDGKDLSRWSTAVELFSANPKFVDPSKRQMVIDAQRQLQEQKVQSVAEAQVPAVEGAQEARSSTQEARGRLAMFDSISADDPEAAQRVEAFTKVYGSTERLHQQIEADKLVIQADDLRTQEREKFASALRMAPAELAKQSAAQLDPKTMLLPLISKAIQEKGLEGLNQQDRNRIDAFYTINGQPDKLAVFSEGSKVNELKRYQQDLADVNILTGAIKQVQSVMTAGKERIDTYEAAAQDALSLVENHGTKMSTTSYEQRQAALEQLKTGTAAVMQDWEETIAPVREELTKGATNAHNTVKQLDEQMRRPGVDRVTLAKRKDFALQTAEIYERMNNTLGLSSDVDLALKRNEIRALEIDAKTGESAEARESAQALIPKRKQELTMLAQQVEKNKASIELDRERLSRFAKLSQARITAGDKKLEQYQQNSAMANAFLPEWVASGFKLAPDTWSTNNGKFFEGYDPKIFNEIVKPVMDSRKELSQGLAEQELLRSGDPKQAGPIAAKYNLKPSDILPVLKVPNQPMVQIQMKQETAEGQTVGKGFGEQYLKTQEAGIDAMGRLTKLGRMEQLLQGVQTGGLVPTMTQIQSIADSLGFQVDKSLPAKQALEALSNEMALQLRNPAGGAGMPGAMSDKDREFLVAMSPGLSKTPEGNAMIISTAKQIAKRDQDVAKMARAYRQKKGHLDEGFYDELQSFADTHPLFGGPPTVKNDADYLKLAPGTVYIGPDGQKRTKK